MNRRAISSMNIVPSGRKVMVHCPFEVLVRDPYLVGIFLIVSFHGLLAPCSFWTLEQSLQKRRRWKLCFWYGAEGCAGRGVSANLTGSCDMLPV